MVTLTPIKFRDENDWWHFCYTFFLYYRWVQNQVSNLFDIKYNDIEMVKYRIPIYLYFISICYTLVLYLLENSVKWCLIAIILWKMSTVNKPKTELIIFPLLLNQRLQFIWVPGHKDIAGNELVDELVGSAASTRMIEPQPYITVGNNFKPCVMPGC